MAARHFEVYQKLAHKYKWTTDTGDSVYQISCEHLRRVYTSMAKQASSISDSRLSSLMTIIWLRN